MLTPFQKDIVRPAGKAKGFVYLRGMVAGQRLDRHGARDAVRHPTAPREEE
jgi:hypothetical protein